MLMTVEDKKTEEVKEIPRETIAKLTEFETKYRVETHLLTEFKKIVDALPGKKKFVYVEGPDYYFMNSHILKQYSEFAESLKKEDKEKLLELIDNTLGKMPTFIRYRKPSHNLDNGRTELATKYKREGAKNNIQREETNVRVDHTDEYSVRNFINNFLYTTNFSIYKTCHIYNFDEVTLVFYSVYDTTDGKASKTDSFLEIEICEEKISEMTEEEAWALIVKYEKILESVGINAQKRLRKSLFEMYKRG